MLMRLVTVMSAAVLFWVRLEAAARAVWMAAAARAESMAWALSK